MFASWLSDSAHVGAGSEQRIDCVAVAEVRGQVERRPAVGTLPAQRGRLGAGDLAHARGVAQRGGLEQRQRRLRGQQRRQLVALPRYTAARIGVGDAMLSSCA